MNGIEKYTRLGLNAASTATSLGFTAAKTGTKLGFGIARAVTSTTARAAGSTVDYALFGGVGTVGPALGGAASSFISLVEQVALAPILLGETITSTSIVAAESGIDTLASFFPGSDEASFSLASFVTLVKREWNDPALRHELPEQRFSVTEVAKALISWAALQGVTQEWQEDRWFQVLSEIDVEEPKENEGEDDDTERRKSRIHITSDAMIPQDLGQVVTADIGEVSLDEHVYEGRTLGKGVKQQGTSTSRRRASHLKLKSNLRRLSKMVLGGYGGAGLIFFGVSLSPTNSDAKATEERTLADAVDAAEQEAQSSARFPAPAPSAPLAKDYSWWNVLMGKHDKEIFEGYAFTPATVRQSSGKRRRVKDRPSTTTFGNEPNMPRYWVLTDHGRRQVVLVFRGTMSLNELAVDLTCDPAPFRPGATSMNENEDAGVDQTTMPGSLPFPSIVEPPTPDSYTSSMSFESERVYKVHGGMLRMAQVMGAADKPVHRAVRDALSKNIGYDLIICGHSLGAGVAALLALSWADPKTCLTVPASGLPVGRRVTAYCFATPCIVCPALSSLSYELITSFVYSHDIVSRLSLGSIRDITRAALWLCNAHNETPKEGKEPEGYGAVTMRAMKWKAGYGNEDDPQWFLAIRKTLEANMHMADLFPAGRTFWGVRNGELSSKHQLNGISQGKVRLFEVLDVEKMFGQIIFARDMLSSHLPHRYDEVFHELL
ncbi:alpha/beta-hydrolase [Schizopora paradoxa]|uniref:sn-1-specific diacylglycerol lipase n=1 Tax=Schizopora paradoxa TaxID=27342 RepID=A0A0H2R038_9AGAM|nr:alpha/beta-hydrolase [Schizopora paradoxa]